MDEYRKKLKELSDKAFEDGDYRTLKELRYEILQCDREHSSPPKKVQASEGFEESEKQLTFSMEEARKANDIYSMLVIAKKMKKKP